jgi:hypothetical protein
MVIRSTTPDEPSLSGNATDDGLRAGRPIRTVMVALAGVVTLGVLAGCGGGSSASTAAPKPGAATAAATSAATQTTPDDSSTPQLNTAPASVGGKVPTPTGDDRKTLLFLLKAIDPKMIQDDSTLISKSEELCGHMLAGDSTAKLHAETQKIFTKGSYTPESYQMLAIEQAIVAEFCR